MESTCTKESNSIAKRDDTTSAPPTHPTKDKCFFSHRIFLVLKLSGVESAAFTRPTPWTQRSFSVFFCHVRRFFANHFFISLWKYHWLVVIKPTPLKNMSSSVGMMTFPYIYTYIYIWKNKSHVPNRNPSSKSCNAAVGRSVADLAKERLICCASLRRSPTACRSPKILRLCRGVLKKRTWNVTTSKVD